MLSNEIPSVVELKQLAIPEMLPVNADWVGTPLFKKQWLFTLFQVKEPQSGVLEQS